MATNLLREYIRELLIERRGGSVHPKIYAMINRAEEEGYKVRVGNYSVVLVDSTDNIIAHLGWDDDPMYGPCLKAKHVTNASAEQAPGFGPLLYDVAIEVTGGLTPDRTTVSNAARDVWDYYYTARPDVKAIQLDDLTNYLTAEDEDNCEQLSAEEDSQNGGNWDDSVLSRKYVKQGRPVYNELRSRGMLVEK